MSRSLYRTLYTALMGSAVGGFLVFMAGHVTIAVLLWVVAFACVLGIVVPMARAGLKQVDRKPVDVAPDAVAPATAPAPLDTVLRALDALNDPDIPFQIDAEPTSYGACVTVRWRIEELRWKAIFSRGSFAMRWKMVIKLHTSGARYGFLEYTSQARVSEGVWPPHFSGGWRWSLGKTAGRRNVHIVMAPGGTVETSTHGFDGPRTSWIGATSIRPADAKIPVLTTLRNHGWRPRLDWWGARLFER